MHTTEDKIKKLLLYVLIIGTCTYIGNCCLTWNIDGNSIEFICRFGNTRTLNLVDIYGHNVARCILIGSSGNCYSPSFVQSTIQENAVTFYIDTTRRTGINGNWSCLQEDNNSTAEVLTTKDITDSTTVNLFGTISQDKDVHRLFLTCSSCRIPKGKNAEFLMNNNSVDHITFNDDTGKCTHLHGECITGKCNCSHSGNTFTRMFVLTKPLKTPTYFSCDLRFEDKAKSVVFSKVPTVSFNGIEFEDRGTRTVISKLSYDPSRPKDEDKKKETVQVVMSVFSALAFVVILLALLVSLYRKGKKQKKKKNTDEDIPFIEITDQSCIVHHEEPTQFKDISLQCALSRDAINLITNTNNVSFKVNVEEESLSHDMLLHDVDRIQYPVVQTVAEITDQSSLVHHEEPTQFKDISLQCALSRDAINLITKTNDQSIQVYLEENGLFPETYDKSFQVNFEEDSFRHETNDQWIQVNFDENSLSHEINEKSIRVNVEGDNRLLEKDEKLDYQLESSTNTDIVERVLNILSMGMSFSRPPQPVDAKLDVIFMNCESIIEQKWVLIVAEVLEKEYGLHCGIPGIDIESFKCVSETSKVIITFSEKSARIPDALTMAEFLPVVVIVMVEECSIPIQLTNMKCVDATKDTNTWLNQLLIALKLRDP